jgi:hypothetical protein
MAVRTAWRLFFDRVALNAGSTTERERHATATQCQSVTANPIDTDGTTIWGHTIRRHTISRAAIPRDWHPAPEANTLADA